MSEIFDEIAIFFSKNQRIMNVLMGDTMIHIEN